MRAPPDGFFSARQGVRLPLPAEQGSRSLFLVVARVRGAPNGLQQQQSVCVCVRVCASACVHVRACACVCVRVRACARARVHARAHARARARARAHRRAHLRARACVRVRVRALVRSCA
eukprot:8786871-Alexandrium_andersonii.AAC.1